MATTDKSGINITAGIFFCDGSYKSQSQKYWYCFSKEINQLYSIYYVRNKNHARVLK